MAGLAPEGPRGLSVGSFVPVSLEPALVGFFVARTSTSWPEIEASGGFCVSVLGEDQAWLSAHFAVPSPDKFDGVAWHAARSGRPVIDGAVAWVDCQIAAVHPAGDHLLVLGTVNDLGVGTGRPPLLHHRGGYRRAHDLDSAAEDAADGGGGPRPAEPDVASREPVSDARPPAGQQRPPGGQPP